MPKRKIVKIDEDKCTGCGLCVPSCAEGALQIIDGKARLVKDIYCDGLGDCLGECPEDAISIEERDADEFDEQAVATHLENEGQKKAAAAPSPPPAPHGHGSGGCPGARMQRLAPATDSPQTRQTKDAPSRLGHWPVQLHLLPPDGNIWQDADVLIAADCVAFAMADFHERLLKGRTVAIGCPKLDDLGAYAEKLAGVFAHNPIRSVTAVRMEVPCCSGIVTAARQALEGSGRPDVPFREVVVGINGSILSDSAAE